MRKILALPMSSRWTLLLCTAAIVSALPAAADDAGAEEIATIASTVAELEARSGLLDVYVDEDKGRVLLALPAPGEDQVIGSYLYIEGLTTGLGSNPVGLDRGQLGETRVINVRRLGKKVLFEEPNLAFRAVTDNAAERRATRQAFATSVIWGGDAEVVDPDGRSLVDITSFLVRDAHGVSQRLAWSDQGSYKLDADRSVIDYDACLAFPDNLEFEAILTYAGDGSGSHVRSTTPSPDSITLVQHHSLVRLPDAGYQPRKFDPRMASFAVSFLDYAVPLDEPIRQQWIVRHRLERTDPTAATSPAKEPIVYYVDPGTPEPIRSALVEGASWWAAAFEQAGFEDAYRVELLPEGAHPLDVRYNVIQWVHRSTRGWSYGGGVTDPRTGEMIKGHVSLGSLRIRQDILLFEGLSDADGTGSGGPDDPIEVALARIRQLSAHEVGHTLGFNHNFAASTYGRASVMDYPAPWLKVGDDGAIDFSQAYAVGAGAWDVHAAEWAYREFPPGVDEAAALGELVDLAIANGLVFLSDADARPQGAANPLAALWDNGSDPVAALEEILAVRRAGLDGFGQNNVASGRPLALLEEVLAPLYFHHQFQVEAAIKVIGGVDYRYKVRGDEQELPTPISGQRQRQALKTVLRTISASELALPDNVLDVMHPRASGMRGNRELFNGRTAPVFDPVAAAATAADLTVSLLLHPARLNRIAEFSSQDPSMPGVSDILDATVATAFASVDARKAGVASAIQEVLARRLVTLAGDSRASVAVRAAAEMAVHGFSSMNGDPVAGYLAASAERWLERGFDAHPVADPAPDIPPGSPIGATTLPGLMTCSWQPDFLTEGD